MSEKQLQACEGGRSMMMKKSISHKGIIVDVVFEDNEINISIWKKDDILPMGYEYIKEFDVEVTK